MATPNNGITVVPTSGNYTGNQNLTISAEEVTGRLENAQGQMVGRKAAFGASGTNQYSSVKSPNTLIVTQEGKAAFIEVSTTSSTSAFPADGGPITFTGYSNLKQIPLTKSSNLGFTSATINNAQPAITDISNFAGNGYTVPGDPGNTAKYPVTFVFSVPENQDPSNPAEYTFTLGGTQHTIRQSASGEYTLKFGYNNVEPSTDVEVLLNANGLPKVANTYKVIATSGLTWEITEEED